MMVIMMMMMRMVSSVIGRDGSRAMRIPGLILANDEVRIALYYA